MKKTLAILGSGDLGQQIAYYAISDRHYEDIVFFDDFSSESENERNDYRIIGNSETIEESYKKGLFQELIIGLGYKHLKKKKEFYMRFNGVIPFGKIIHSTSWVAESASVEEGCVIYPGCAIDSNVIIRANTLVNIGCTISHDTLIEEHCFLSPRVAIAGFVRINEMVILGINSTVIDNITIASQTQLGGGSVVIKNISEEGLYVGNPIKFIRKL